MQKKGMEDMKKLLCVLLTAVMVLALIACGGDKTAQEGEDPQQDPSAQVVDLKKTAEDAVAALGDAYPMFPVESAEELEGLYPGLAAVETRQVVAYQPPVSGFGCELAMVEVANAADAETVRAIFRDRVDGFVNDTAYPENAPAWKNNSSVTVNGNYVVLGVLPEGVDLPPAFRGEF